MLLNHNNNDESHSTIFDTLQQKYWFNFWNYSKLVYHIWASDSRAYFINIFEKNI